MSSPSIISIQGLKLKLFGSKLFTVLSFQTHLSFLPSIISFYILQVWYVFRCEDSGENGDAVREMTEMTEKGAAFYIESGVVHKLVGILRAADIFWNPAKK